MLRFEILADGVLIGHSDLEFGDPPMGVAEGKFLPLPGYFAIQPMVVAARENGLQTHLALVAREPNGPALPAQGGVYIRDYSAELGAEGLTVEVLGIGYPLYGELFPSHVEAYRARFPSRN
jgi:hypothetical protein